MDFLRAFLIILGCVLFFFGTLPFCPEAYRLRVVSAGLFCVTLSTALALRL